MAFRALLSNEGVGHEVLSSPYRIEDQIKAKRRCHLAGTNGRYEEPYDRLIRSEGFNLRMSPIRVRRLKPALRRAA